MCSKMRFKITFTTEVNAIDEVEAEEKAFNKKNNWKYKVEVERR